MTILIATSVVRGSRQGESHGGVYLVDFEARRAAQALDWNTMNIDWQGRGWDRGLRGIEVVGDTVYVAASDELFAYTPDFELIGSWRNPFLKHCHEIMRHERTLFLTSTGFDSILGFDLDRKEFSWGLHISPREDALACHTFDPELGGPAPSNALHLNNVHCTSRGMFISGLRTQGVWAFTGRELQRWVRLPADVHNAQPFRDGVLFNDTQADMVRFVTPRNERVFRVPRFEEHELTHRSAEDEKLARQAFARGLCVIDENTIACGSSPSTISLHDLKPGGGSRIATLTYDVRNAIHGLAVWPFGWRENLPVSHQQL